jgi:hypothetical protein
MSFLRLNGAIRVILAASAVLAASSQVARAETIFLNCTHQNSEGGYSLTFTVDLTNSTVENLSATINVTTIDWVRHASNNGITSETYFHINRTTGVLTTWTSYHWSGQTQTSARTDYSCTVGGQPPTKF